jgi:hypothetical protein
VVADLGLIDTKHQSVKDRWREVIVVNLVALVRRLNLWSIIVE